MALIVGAAQTKEAAAAIGFALAGAAITRAVDAIQDRRREKGEEEARRRADLDETRRLAYMVLVAARTKHPELVATVANALAHHGLHVPFQEAATHLARVLMGDTGGESERWLQEQIDHMTARLDIQTERHSR